MSHSHDYQVLGEAQSEFRPPPYQVGGSSSGLPWFGPGPVYVGWELKGARHIFWL